MFDISRLPIEIIDMILDYLPLKSSAKLALVNKSCSDKVKFHLYKMPVVYRKIKHRSDADKFWNIIYIMYKFPKVFPHYKKNIKRISFFPKFTDELKKFPDTVTHIEFPFSYKNDIINDIFPKSLLNLEFHYPCKIKAGIIPNSVTHLTLMHYAENIIPDSVTHLNLRVTHGEKIEKLPKNLVSLKFFSSNDQSFRDKNDNRVIPNSVRKLDLATMTNFASIWNNNSKSKQWWGVIPDNVEYLDITLDTKSTLRGIFPNTIKHLTLRGIFNEPIHVYMTNSLEFLKISKHVRYEEVNGRYIIYSLPKYVTHLTFNFHFNQPLLNLRYPPHKIRNIPSSVTHLIFGYNFNKSVEFAIPNSVIYLKFGDCFDQPIDSLPHSIKYLILGRGFKQELVLPPNLVYLKISKKIPISDEIKARGIQIEYL